MYPIDVYKYYQIPLDRNYYSRGGFDFKPFQF